MDNSWLWLFRKMGGNTLGTLMIPMLAAYMAYSLGIRRLLARDLRPVSRQSDHGGFLCGMLAVLWPDIPILDFWRKQCPPKES